MGGQLRRTLLLLSAVGAVALTAGQAEARRMRLPIFIPGVGGDTLVKVKDLPDRAPFISRDGKFIDLGYRFKSYGGGEWIGYIGSSRSYLPLKPGGAEMLAFAAGMTQLPPVPSRPAGSWLWFVLFVIGALVIARKVFGKIFGRATGGREADAAEAGLKAAAEQRLREDAALAARLRAPTVSARRGAIAGGAAMPAASLGGGGVVGSAGGSFGRRGGFGQR